jgi:hypothetical protein
MAASNLSSKGVVFSVMKHAFTKFTSAELNLQHVLIFCLFCFDDWLTVHRSITLVDFQLDAQNSYLFIYNTFI